MGSCPSKPGEPGYTGPPVTEPPKPPPAPEPEPVKEKEPAPVPAPEPEKPDETEPLPPLPPPPNPPPNLIQGGPPIPSTERPVIPPEAPEEPPPAPEEDALEGVVAETPPNNKCGIILDWIVTRPDVRAITVEDVLNILAKGVTEQELEECVAAFQQTNPAVRLPPKPWIYPVPPPSGPVIGAPPNIIPVETVPTTASAKLINFINSRVLEKTEWENEAKALETLGKITSLLGGTVEIADKSTKLPAGTRFVNVEVRTDNRYRWISKPLPDNITESAIQQTGGAVKTYKFVIYAKSSTGGRRTPRKHPRKNKRKTLKKK